MIRMDEKGIKERAKEVLEEIENHLNIYEEDDTGTLELVRDCVNLAEELRGENPLAHYDEIGEIIGLLGAWFEKWEENHEYNDLPIWGRLWNIRNLFGEIRDRMTTGPLLHKEGAWCSCHACDRQIVMGEYYVEPAHREGYGGWSPLCLACFEAGDWPVFGPRSKCSPTTRFVGQLVLQGNGLAVRVHREHTDALGVDRGDHLVVTLRRADF